MSEADDRAAAAAEAERVRQQILAAERKRLADEAARAERERPSGGKR